MRSDARSTRSTMLLAGRPVASLGALALALSPGTTRAADASAFERWVARHKIPVGDSVTSLVEYLK